MLFMQAVIAALAIIGLVMASEDLQEEETILHERGDESEIRHPVLPDMPQVYHHASNQILHPGYEAEQQQNSLFQGFPNIPHSEPWPIPVADMPKLIHLDVKCEKNLMKVSMEFDRPFHGVIFSKGHFGRCVHLPPGSGQTSVYFDVSASGCGTQGSAQGGYFENTVVVQYDPQLQEAWDQARRLRCTWHDQYEKAVTFRPFPVDALQVVRADFAGDNVGCWMQIQAGKGPWASEVSGIVRIGQTMTMVLAIKDEENRFDMMVRNCIAHDGKRAPIELVDGRGCVVRPKLLSRFTKVKNFGSSASVLAFAHFQAFKFPDSMDVHFQCTIQICRPHCPEQCVRHRQERDLSTETAEVGLNRVIRVVASADLDFPGWPEAIHMEESDLICMSTPGFAASLVVLLCILVVSSLVAAFLCLRKKNSVVKKT